MVEEANEDPDLKAATQAIKDEEKGQKEDSTYSTPIQSLAHAKDEEDEKKPANPRSLATLMSKKEELVAAKEKIQSNIDASQKALANHTSHVKELKDIIKTQPEGAARVELEKVLDNAKKHVSELEDHIKQGEKLVDAKDKSIDQIESKLAKTADADVGQAKMIASAAKDKATEQESKLEKDSASGEPDKDSDPKEQRALALTKAAKNEKKAKELRKEAKALKPEVIKAET